ncbi:transcriptional regulator swi6, partial [Coemansia javaensis]
MVEHEYASRVYVAVYSGIQVYEMICRGVAVMRRYSDSWLNATQLLKVAGVDKGRRTKILEREVLTGVHEKIQGGYGKYQGTWVPFERGIQLCKQYAIHDYVRPILEHDPTESGTRPDKTPTKAEVRRLMKVTTAADSAQRSGSRGPAPGPSPGFGGMLLLPPPPLPPSQAKRDRPVAGPAASKRYRTASSTATSPLNSDIALGGYHHHHHLGAPSTPGILRGDRADLVPPLASSATQFRQSMYSSPAISYGADTPAGPPGGAPMWRYRAGNEELSSQTIAEADLGAAAAAGDGSAARNDRIKLMQIFLNEDANFIPDWLAEEGSPGADGAQKPLAVDVDLPIDDQGHAAVHWAAALARIQVLDLLLFHGADARRLNYDGESALVRAVQVTNNYETQTFPDLLELLHDTIPLTDKHNRTVLHHIALAVGAEGREKAARYYADCLLSWIVRLAGGYQVDADDPAAAAAEPDAAAGAKVLRGAEKPDTLPTPAQSSSSPGGRGAGGAQAPPGEAAQHSSQTTERAESPADEADDQLAADGADAGSSADFAAFLNLQDDQGNTALNLAARAGDRAMIRMLINAGASATIPNRVGLCPLDFGVDQIAQADARAGAGADADADDGAPEPWAGDGALAGGTPRLGRDALDGPASPTPSGRGRARAVLLPQTPLRSAGRGAPKSLLSSLVAGCGESSPMRGPPGPAHGEPDGIWSPVSAEQRVRHSVVKIQRLMADLESDFAGEMKCKQAHFAEIKQQLRNTTIELARARETIHSLHTKVSQLDEIRARVGFLEETLARETAAVRDAIATLPAGSKPRQDLEALLASLLASTAHDDSDAEPDLPRIPGNAVNDDSGNGNDDDDDAEAEQDPARLQAAVERLRIINQVYARRDALLRERVAVLRRRADVSERERQYRQIIASCCEISEADVDVWIDKLISAVEAAGDEAGGGGGGGGDDAIATAD